MQGFLMNFDMFGTIPGFYIKGKKEYTSKFSTFITLLIYMIVLIFGVLFSRELWEKALPKINESTENTEHPKKFQYPTDFFFLLSIQTQDYARYIDESVYYAIGVLFQTVVNSTGTYFITHQLKADRCSNVVGKNSVHYELLKEKELNNFYCLSLDQKEANVSSEDLYLNDVWGNNGFQMIQFQLFECGSKNDPKNCKSREEIDKILEKPTLSFYYLEHVVDTNNYTHPLIPLFKENFYYISNQKSTKETQFVKHINVNTDEGLLLTRMKTKSGLIAEKYTENIEEGHSANGQFFSMSFQITNSVHNYRRSYYKIQDLGANISGIYSILMIIFIKLLQFYNSSCYLLEVINKLFNIRKKKELKKFNGLLTNYNRPKTMIFPKSKKNNDKNNVYQNNNQLLLLQKYSKEKKTCQKEGEREVANNIEQNIINNIYSLSVRKKDKNASDNSMMNLIESIIPKKKETKIDDKKYFSFNSVEKIIHLNLNRYCRTKCLKDKKFKAYNLGKKFITDTLDLNNYLKTVCLGTTLFKLKYSDESRKKIEYLSSPILSPTYAGERFLSNSIRRKINELNN